MKYGSEPSNEHKHATTSARDEHKTRSAMLETSSPTPPTSRRGRTGSSPSAVREAEIADSRTQQLPSIAEISGAVQHSTPGARPRRTPDERREQNRLTVQRFYYRKKRMLQDMREEEARLRQEFAALSATVSERSAASEQSETTQLILLKESLQSQNDLLRERMSVQTQLVLQFRRAFTAGRQQVFESLESRLASFEYIPQVSLESCEQFVRAALRDISEQKAATPGPSDLKISVFGWDCTFVAPGGAGAASSPRFVFSKRLASGVSAAHISERTLKMWTPSDAMHAHMFPVYAHSELRLLQCLDDRNLIVLQTLAMSDRGAASSPSTADPTLASFIDESEPESMDLQHHVLLSHLNGAAPSAPADTTDNSVGQKLTRTVLHVALVDRGSGERVFFARSIPPIHYELSRVGTATDDPTHAGAAEWVELFNWCSVADGAGGGGAEVTWGGTTPSTAHYGMSAFEWLIYELTRTMRWELAVTDSSIIVSEP